MTWHTNTTGGASDRPLPDNCRGARPAPDELDTCTWCGHWRTAHPSEVTRFALALSRACTVTDCNCGGFGDD